MFFYVFGLYRCPPDTVQSQPCMVLQPPPMGPQPRSYFLFGVFTMICCNFILGKSCSRFKIVLYWPRPMSLRVRSHSPVLRQMLWLVIFERNILNVINLFRHSDCYWGYWENLGTANIIWPIYFSIGAYMLYGVQAYLANGLSTF